ncbi:MAG: HRDC domain-containing protein [Myxococcaceae bacterium]
MPTFAETTTDVLTAEGMRDALARLDKEKQLAVDVEADSMHAFRARLCFVQVGTDDDVFVFDTLAPDVEARALAGLFGDPERTKIFHAAGGDLQFLAEQGIRVKGLFDTHRAATLLGWQKVGLADLARDRLGIELAKEHQQSDFSIRPLPEGMHQYIANDVRYLCEIGRQVREECLKADILEEVELDCLRLADEAAARPDIGTDFKLKLPKHQMKPQEYALGLALAERLHALRLRAAEEANVPMGRMLSNAAVTAIATRPPSNLRELAKAQGVRGPFVREHGEEVLGLIRELIEKVRNGELKVETDDRGQRDPGRRKRAEELKIFRSAKANERKVTPSVVLPNPVLEELAAHPPQSLEELAQVPYLGEKRVRLYGAELLHLLQAG